LGGEIDKFEKKIAKLCRVKYAVALNSGTDALTIGMYLLGVRRGDEVITPPNSFISSTSSIIHLGAKPVFADVLDNQNIDPKEIKKKITKKTKAIMPVHLTGRVCQMKEIIDISKKYNIPVIEDAAQSIGSMYYGKKSGSFGDIGCFSAHPLKNLNACGDAGFLVTNNSKIYKKAKILRNHGLEDRNLVKNFGYISRMDILQASILNFRLKKLNSTIFKRRQNAKFYLNNIDRKFYDLIDEKKFEFNTYHTFVIQTKKRNKLINYLKKKRNRNRYSLSYPNTFTTCI
jgi:dTDP-4-amino-4,6-dideoxygalactose transaminase